MLRAGPRMLPDSAEFRRDRLRILLMARQAIRVAEIPVDRRREMVPEVSRIAVETPEKVKARQRTAAPKRDRVRTKAAARERAAVVVKEKVSPRLAQKINMGADLWFASFFAFSRSLIRKHESGFDGSSWIDYAPALAVDFVMRETLGGLDEDGLDLLRRE